MMSIHSKGGNKLLTALKKLRDHRLMSELSAYGEMGVKALSASTPTETGESASSWGYRVQNGRKGPSIEWYNTNLDDSGRTPVVILLQYGHGTGSGGYVHGRDFINPAMQPVFDHIADEVWKKVRSIR